MPWLTAKQATGTAVRSLAAVWGLPIPACTPEVVAESHLHPCWDWIFDAHLGTADHVPAALTLFVGLLYAGYKIWWLLLVQSLLGWSWVVEGCCAGRAGL